MLKLIQDSLAQQQSDEYQQNKDNVQQLDNIILCLQDSMKINSGSDLALIKAELLIQLCTYNLFMDQYENVNLYSNRLNILSKKLNDTSTIEIAKIYEYYHKLTSPTS